MMSFGDPRRYRLRNGDHGAARTPDEAREIERRDREFDRICLRDDNGDFVAEMEVPLRWNSTRVVIYNDEAYEITNSWYGTHNYSKTSTYVCKPVTASENRPD